MDIDILLSQSESEFLDFKKTFHEKNIDLIHDILCLSNSYVEGDRYIVFGVTDDKNIVGIEKNKKKTNSHIQDLLRQTNFNRIPTVRLDEYQIYGYTISVLTIKNRPDKPFYLTKDKTHQGKTIRAGVIYTRLGDTNIPLKETAPEDHIELMWRERFGLGLDPLSHVLKLIEEREKWSDSGTESYMYHKDFPEFTIRDGEEFNYDFLTTWTKSFPDPSAYSYDVEIRYHTTILKRITFVGCDGGRYRIPAPIPVSVPEGDNGIAWLIPMDSLGYKVSTLYNQYYDISRALPPRGVQLVPSLEDLHYGEIF